MSDTKLGKLIEGDAQRDAIHVAIAPVEALTRLKPGQHVGLRDGKACGDADSLIGIVDPFLNGPVQPGERFWLCLYQFTITGMRHHWAHPEFAQVDPAFVRPDYTASKQWIEDYARELGTTYEELMEAGATGNVHFGDDLDHYEPKPEFYSHYAAITGKPSAQIYFSCSC